MNENLNITKNTAKNTDRTELKQKAILICIQYPDMNKNEATIHVSELESLVDTMGAKTIKTLIIPLKKISPKFLVGSGKALEVSDIAEDLDAEVIIFDNELSPGQQRNLEEITGRCVIDRHEVILDIFAGRATTREAVLQIGLARMEYSLPRLTRAWTHLSRQKGGMKGTKGEGETQLEVDRRIVLRKITKLKNELVKVRQHRNTLRKQRHSTSISRGAIVGYTNAGKSSLLNTLAGANVFVEDKLFATLDPITRRVTLPEGQKLLLTDTVGFIRKLPHKLIDAFRATLEETVLADFLIHVLDISHPDVDEHYKITMEVLDELGAGDKPVIVVFNKIDLRESPIESHSIEFNYQDALYISTKTKKGIDGLSQKIEQLLDIDKYIITLSIPTDRYDLISMIHIEGTVLEEKYMDTESLIKARVPIKLYNKLKDYIVNNYQKNNEKESPAVKPFYE